MISNQFAGQTALITGAGQGIGFEIAMELASKGSSVLLNDISEESARNAEEIIRGRGGNCTAITGDAGDQVFIERMVEKAVNQFGSLDIAIANAGITLFGDFFSYTQTALQKVMQLNLGGSFLLAQASARQMRKQGTGGSILFMSSVTGHQAHKHLAAYGMTKAGLEMLARALVIELSPYQITVNAIAPGATLTERTRMEKEYEKTWSGLTPMGRPAGVSDIANAALFLVSRSSRHITGQNLIIDGGWSVISPYNE